MDVIPRSLCLAGADGAGKSTQTERLVRRLAARGVESRLCTIWDLLDQSAPGAIPFGSKRDVDKFLASLHPDGRAMFLHMAMREALDRAIADRGDRLLIVVGYWLKYNATERAYGADSRLLDHLGEVFAPLERSIFLDLPPETALERKQVVSGYESGLEGREGFLDFQGRVHDETRKLLAKTGPWHVIDGRADEETVERAIAEHVDAWLGLEALA